MNMRKIVAAISLAMNLLVFILVIYCTSLYFVETGVGNMAVNGAECFRYFTIDSNILCAFTGIFVIIGDLFVILGMSDRLPGYAILIKQVGTTAITVTFLTVMFFLGPTQGYDKMFAGGNLCMHLICPLLAIVSYLFFECGQGTSFKMVLLNSLYGLIPVVLYGGVYLVQVVILESWSDFYGFNRGGMWYISIIAMLMAAYAISLMLMAAQNSIARKLEKVEERKGI